MKTPVPVTKRHSVLIKILAVAALTLLSALAGAQDADTAGPAGKKSTVPSISNLHNKTQEKGSGSNIALRVASEPAVADAIAAASLGNVFQFANDEHWHKGEYNHTINLNQVVIEGDPKNLDAYSNNGWLLWSTDRSNEGLATVKKGLAANPNDFYMYDEVGNFYRLYLKDYRSALPYFEKAAKFECPLLTWHGLAQCYEKTGQWDKAVRTWATACKNPADTLAPVRLKRAQAQLDKLKGSGK